MPSHEINLIQIRRIMDEMKRECNNNYSDFVSRIDKYSEALRNQFDLNYIVMRPDSYITGLQEFCKTFPKEWEIVEIGAYAGESTRVFSEHFKKVYSIDPWNLIKFKDQVETVELWTKGLAGAEVAFDELCKEKGNIVKLKGFDKDFINTFENNILDIVYIDANHHYEEVKQNLVSWYDKVKPGGILSGHDYYDGTPGVIKAVDELFGKPDKVFEDYSWYITKDKKNVDKSL